MYRPLDDSVFSCFSSKCCQTLSRSRRRCGKPVDRRRSSHRSTTRNIDENKHQRVGFNARERQIRSEISLLSGQHRLLLRSSSSNRLRKDQLQELFNVSQGRSKQVRAGYRPLENPTGTYFLPPDRAYSGKHTNLYHSVVAFSTLFFTLLLIISSISTSMTVQGVAGLADRSANKSLAPPSRISGNLVQTPGTPFRPLNALKTKVSPSKAVRLKNSRGLVGAMLSNQSDRSPRTDTAETPRKLFNVSNSRIFKSIKKRTTARETSFIGRENWLGVSGNDKLSPNLIEEKHRFFQPPGVSISNETKSFSLIPVKDLNLSSITPETQSTLVNPKKVRKLTASKRADDNYSSSSESDKRMSRSSLEVSAPERLFNRSRRYRKGSEIVGDSLKEAGQGSIETTQEQQVQQQPPQQQQQPKTCGIDAHANETADHVQDFRWNIDNPNMLLEEHFTTPFLSLHSDLQFPLEHSSKECLEDESFPAGKEEAATAAFESSFERYNRRQRLTAFDVCQSFGANDQKTNEYLYLPFCSHLRVIDALSAADLGRLTADKTRGEVCPSPVVRLLKFDQNAKSIHCLFENAISYYNCEDMYSKTARCDQCKAAHKLWICSLLIPHYSNDTRVPGCPHYEQIVENRCPYLSPHANNQYAGEAMFQSKNDRASINEVLMMKEDVRPTCHYPCLVDQQGSHNFTPQGDLGQVYDHNSRYPVDDSSLDGFKRSSPQRMSVCLSHELDTAPDWSFDQEDALLLDLELKRHRDGNT